MNRLLIHVEGQTEETFVKRVLSPHLALSGVAASARLMGNARQRNRRGGVRGWGEVRKDITRHLKQDAECCATLMVDYYGLPSSGDKEWPGRSAANAAAFAVKATTVQNALLHDVTADMGAGFNPARFVPFVIMHEFEGWLFSDCTKFAVGIGAPQLAPQFQIIRNGFISPEEINDSPQTAPSKRILHLMPGYQKPTLGTLAALEIGLQKIRQECPHFANWLTQLEQLGT